MRVPKKPLTQATSLSPGSMQIDDARFHARHAGGADGKSEMVLGLECLPQHVLDLVHEHDELRIEVPHERRGHRGQHARMHVAGTGAKQQYAAADSIDQVSTQQYSFENRVKATNSSFVPAPRR